MFDGGSRREGMPFTHTSPNQNQNTSGKCTPKSYDTLRQAEFAEIVAMLSSGRLYVEKFDREGLARRDWTTTTKSGSGQADPGRNEASGK